jgi:hypothetical protein
VSPLFAFHHIATLARYHATKIDANYAAMALEQCRSAPWRPPNPRSRLDRAAMKLFMEVRFELTTVAVIAQQAGNDSQAFLVEMGEYRSPVSWPARTLDSMGFRARIDYNSSHK